MGSFNVWDSFFFCSDNPLLHVAVLIQFDLQFGIRMMITFANNLDPNLKVIKLEFVLILKIKRNGWLLVDTCPQAANHCT